MANRLSNCVREGDTVARLGGDEFALLLRNLDEPREAARVAERVVAAAAEPILLSGRALPVGVSVGVAVDLAPSVNRPPVGRGVTTPESRGRRAASCSVTPTSRCIRRRPRARATSSSSRRPCAPNGWAASSCWNSCGAPRDAASCCSSTSPSWT